MNICDVVISATEIIVISNSRLICFKDRQVPSALALQSATHNIIIPFINLTNMSIANNNKSLNKCILRVLKLCILA